MIENIPHMPLSVCKIIHDLSYTMLYDDRHDIGFFQYYDRNDHYYNGRLAPNHPSPGHHWQGAIFGMIFAQLGAMCSQLRDVCMIMSSISENDPDLLDLDTEIVSEEEALAMPHSPQLSVYQETVAISLGPQRLKARRPQVERVPLIYRKDHDGPVLMDGSGNNLLPERRQVPQLPDPQAEASGEIPPIPEGL